MAGVSLRIHPMTTWRWGKLEEIAGTAVTMQVDDPQANGDPNAELFGLCCTDPDGEIHVFACTEEGKQNLIRQLTGGVIVP